MGQKGLQIIMELLTVKCLQINDVIPILSPLCVVVAVTVNITRCGVNSVSCGEHHIILHCLVLINGCGV